jgi:hypothetical protein
VREFRKTTVDGSSNQDVALMRVNQAIARLEDRRMEVAQWTKAHVKLRARSSSALIDPSARERGRTAGESIRLSRPRGGLADRRLIGNGTE